MRRVEASTTVPHAVLRACTLFGLSLCIGCAHTGPAIPVDADRPLRAELDAEQARIIAERWLLLPVESDEKALSLGIASGSYTVVSSAWKGLALGPNWARPRLNLVIVDLSSGSTGRVFEHQVALGEWTLSFRTEPPHGLRFENTLLVPARAEDTTGDKQIDGADDAAVFAYDLALQTRRRLSPAGYSTAHAQVFGERIALLLRRAGDEALSVYLCDPRTGDGRFVAQDLAP